MNSLGDNGGWCPHGEVSIQFWSKNGSNYASRLRIRSASPLHEVRGIDDNMILFASICVFQIIMTYSRAYFPPFNSRSSSSHNQIQPSGELSSLRQRKLSRSLQRHDDIKATSQSSTLFLRIHFSMGTTFPLPSTLCERDPGRRISRCESHALGKVKMCVPK
jgi:hypothetical protein